MKRFIKILSLILTPAIILTACNKDDKDDLVTLNVEISNYTGNSNTKMYVDENRYTHWSTGDQVKINGTSCPVNLSGSKAQITGVPTSSFGYTAVYPASIASSFGGYTSSISITLPTEQTYAVDGSGNQIINAPLFARCNKDETTLTFQNLCSLLSVTVNNDRTEDIELQSITVTSSGSKLSGAATISNATTTASFAMGTNATSYNYVTLSFTSETVAQGTCKTYYIVVPAFSTSDIAISVVATGAGTLELSKMVSDAELSANTIVQGPTLALNGVAYIGTEENPYKINNLDDLVAFRTRVNSGTTYDGLFVKLMTDIDCGSSWTPIGDGTVYNHKTFKGTFDGNNKTITYVIPSTSSSLLGFFGYTQNATVKNLNVNATIESSGSAIGGIVACQEGGVITGCTATGSIYGSANHYGGIVGRNYASANNSISSCTSSVDITSTKSGANYIGGIMGYFYTAGTITGCNASGDIYAPEETGTYVGGIAGNTTGATNITYCGFTGHVQASEFVGMIIGIKPNTTTISNCTYSAENAGETYKGVGTSGTRKGNDTGCTAE